MDLDVLFTVYTDPLVLARQLVRVFGGRKNELLVAAERWVSYAATELPARSFDPYFPIVDADSGRVKFSVSDSKALVFS